MLYDTSQIKAYMTCPFMYYCKYVIGLKLKDMQAREYNMDFGSRIHSSLEAYYTHLKEKNPLGSVNLDTIWQGYQAPDNEVSKTTEGGIFLFKEYLKRWNEIDRNLRVLDVEKVRHIDINGHDFVVKIDTEIEFQDNIYSLEHKTTSNISNTYFDNYFMDCQITAQTAAVKEVHGSCSGVMVNAMKVKYYKRKYLDKQVGFHSEFQRSIINRTPMELDDWRIQMGAWIDDMQADREGGFFKKACKSTSCQNYNTQCQYTNICKSSKGMEVDDQIVEGLYEFVENPLSYLTEEEVST